MDRTPENAERNRLVELDSLRGVAALSVAVGHLLLTVDPQFNQRGWSPLRAGHEAVILFFVLSGFVLNLTWRGGGARGYAAFALKRITRIYIPYICAIAFALLAMNLVTMTDRPELSPWFNAPWHKDEVQKSLLGHLLVIFPFNDTTILPVVWSLTHEMRLSLVFPLIALLARLRSPSLGWLIGCAIAWVGASRLGDGYDLSFHYAVLFLGGALICQYRGQLLRIVGRPAVGWALLALGLFLYYRHALVVDRFAATIGDHRPFAEDYVIGAGAALLIMAALGVAQVSWLLRTPPLVILGRISYSLYLVHTLVLLTVFHLAAGRVPKELLVAPFLIISLVMAWGMEKVVEQPAIRLGRELADRLRKRRVTYARMA